MTMIPMEDKRQSSGSTAPQPDSLPLPPHSDSRSRPIEESKMTKATLALLSLLVVSAAAWRLKPDDTEKLKRQLEETANADLEAFASGNHESRSKLYQPVKEILEAVEKNNAKVLKGLEPVEGKLVKLSTGEERSRLRNLLLKALTSFIDGNRDNFSYYKLDAVREWADRRLNLLSEAAGSVGGRSDDAESQTLIRLRDLATEARDHLDTMAQAFVKGVKAIKEEASQDDPDRQVMQQTAEGVIAVSDANKPQLLKATADARSLVTDRMQQ